MQIYFILVESAYPENIGAAARAIKTMGISGLRLVSPADHLSKEARWLAHASNDILENAEVYDRFDDAIKDIDFIIASSAKKRSVKQDYLKACELHEFISQKKKSLKKIAVVFGKEESGLDNDIIRNCDVASYIPMKTTYPSLNLAQAVMIYAYELSNLLDPIKTEETASEIESLYPVFKQKLDNLLLELRIEKNENLYNRILERAAYLNNNDINLVLSILNRI
jgi:tRNA/rRNA methyltransferase